LPLGTYIQINHLKSDGRVRLQLIAEALFPFRYWALAVPSFVIVAVALSMAIYMGLNFVATPPPTCFSTIFGERPYCSSFPHSPSKWMYCCFACNSQRVHITINLLFFLLQ
jgi:hypothetical protein